MSSRSAASAARYPRYADAVYAGPTTYAQFAEDLILMRALNTVDCGFYIDIGAWDEARDSVTKLFYEKGWSGINIEPCPRWFDTLIAPRSRDINLRLAASDHAGVVTLHEISETGLSTIVAKYADKYLAQGLPHRAYPVPCRPLRDICDEYVHGDIHFIKIDVEGAEKSVLQGCDFNRFRPWLLVIEATLPTTQTPCYEEWEDLVLGAGYEFALFHEVNRYYVARERLGLKTLIQHPELTQASVQRRKTPSLKFAVQNLPGGLSEECRHNPFSTPPALTSQSLSARELEAGQTQTSFHALSEKRDYLLARGSPAMRTTVLAYVIAAVGIVMLIFGAWSLFVLNNAEIDVALTDEAIVFGLIGGGFAMIGLAQVLRLLLVIVRNTNLALAAKVPQGPER
jgi:FkbM family methyltransferase